jgi:hypothetical protein
MGLDAEFSVEMKHHHPTHLTQWFREYLLFLGVGWRDGSKVFCMGFLPLHHIHVMGHISSDHGGQPLSLILA